MQGKRYTTEDKIRILREADGGKTIGEGCRAHNILEVSFHRWKRQFGMMEINEARRLKELERENAELKKMLAESLLKNRVLEAVCEKKWSAQGTARPWRGRWWRQGCALGERRAGSLGLRGGRMGIEGRRRRHVSKQMEQLLWLFGGVVRCTDLRGSSPRGTTRCALREKLAADAPDGATPDRTDGWRCSCRRSRRPARCSRRSRLLPQMLAGYGKDDGCGRAGWRTRIPRL